MWMSSTTTVSGSCWRRQAGGQLQQPESAQARRACNPQRQVRRRAQPRKKRHTEQVLEAAEHQERTYAQSASGRSLE